MKIEIFVIKHPVSETHPNGYLEFTYSDFMSKATEQEQTDFMILYRPDCTLHKTGIEVNNNNFIPLGLMNEPDKGQKFLEVGYVNGENYPKSYVNWREVMAREDEQRKKLRLKLMS